MKFETNFMETEELTAIRRHGLTVMKMNEMIKHIESFLLERIEGSILRFIREDKTMKDHRTIYEQYDNLKLTCVAYVMGRYGSISEYRTLKNKRISYKTQFAKLSVALELLHAFSFDKISNWFDRAVKNIMN